jgi:hypothetical protein
MHGWFLSVTTGRYGETLPISFYPYKEILMAFSYKNAKGTTYILHSTNTTTKTGKTQTLFFFSKEEKAGALDAVPTGYVVAETANGLPVLKKAA